MLEILLTDLSKVDFYEKTLSTIERLCEDYGIEQHFGTLSMTNQMVCDFLEETPHFSADVSFQIDNDSVSFQYILQSGDFKTLSKADEENTALFVLQSLADEISFSSDFDTLTITFHVKTKIKIQREMQHQEVRKNMFHI